MGVNISSKIATSDAIGLPYNYATTFPVAMSASTLTSATTTGLSATGNVYWSDHGTHSISKIGVMTGAVTAGTDGVLRASLQDVATATAPGQPDGTPDQSVSTSTMPSATTWTEYTLTAARANVAHGTMLAVALELTTAGTSVSIALQGVHTGVILGIGGRQAYSTGAWTSVAAGGVFTVALVATDGTIGWLNGNNPVSAVNTHAFSSSSDPKALGNEYTLPYDVTINGIGFQGIVAEDLTVRLADAAGNTLATTTLLANQVITKTLVRIYPCFITPTTIGAGTKFYIFVTPTTTTNITLYSYDAPSAAYFDMFGLGSYGKYTSISAADAIATATATRRLLAWPIVSSIGAPSSIGGGGVGGIGSEGVVAD